MRSRLLLLLLPAFFMLSCTIEKRLYRSGYHIEWKKRLQTADGEKTHRDAETRIARVRKETDETTDSITEMKAIPVQEMPIVRTEANMNSAKLVKKETPAISSGQLKLSDQAMHNEQAARAKPKAAVVILATVWFIVAGLLVIGGISLIAGSPVWGIILLVLGGIMLFLPLLGVGGGRSKKKKSAAGFASFAPKPRFAKMKLRPDKDIQRKAIIVFILIVLYVLLAILGVIFGISMISGGTVAVGILLLVLGGLMLLIPAAALILVATSGEKH